MKRRKEGAGNRCSDGEPEKVGERERAFSRDLGGTDGDSALERGVGRRWAKLDAPARVTGGRGGVWGDPTPHWRASSGLQWTGQSGKGPASSWWIAWAWGTGSEALGPSSCAAVRTFAPRASWAGGSTWVPAWCTSSGRWVRTAVWTARPPSLSFQVGGWREGGCPPGIWDETRSPSSCQADLGGGRASQ